MISGWFFGTDGEGGSDTFGGAGGDVLAHAPEASWRPEIPAFASTGSGSWVFSGNPAPVPSPPGTILLGSAFLGLGGILRQTRRAGKRRNIAAT